MKLKVSVESAFGGTDRLVTVRFRDGDAVAAIADNANPTWVVIGPEATIGLMLALDTAEVLPIRGQESGIHFLDGYYVHVSWSGVEKSPQSLIAHCPMASSHPRLTHILHALAEAMESTGEAGIALGAHLRNLIIHKPSDP